MLKLYKEKERDLVILNLTDPQLDNNEWNTDAGQILCYTVEELIRRTNPDLITVTGDLAWQSQMESYDKFGQLMEKCGVPWTFVLGNHDNEGGADHSREICNVVSRHGGCLFEHGDAEMGCGNFVILAEEDGKPAVGLIFMDSHIAHFYDVDGVEYERDDGMNEAQLRWYREQIETLEKLGCHHSAVFMHIPVPEFITAYNEALAVPADTLTIEKSYEPDSWNEPYKDSFGIRLENNNIVGPDDGFFDLICELGHTKALICGHEHINCAVIKYKGVSLVFGLKAGRGCYWRPEMNGGTVITANAEGIKEIRHEFVEATHFW